jgi:hypothetical protein
MWTHPWRRHLCARIIVTLLVFFLLEVLPVRARERVAIANVEEEGENETKIIKKRKFPEDVSGTFKGVWHAPSSKLLPTSSREIANKRYFTSGSKGVLQVQMRQQKHDSQHNCFWVEGDLLVRTTSAPAMHINFAGVYLNATGIVHGHGQSRNLEQHVTLENFNEQRFYNSDFRKALRTSASDLEWETAGRKDSNATQSEDGEANDTGTSLYEAMRRRQRLNSLFAGPLNTTAYPSACEFVLKLFIEPGRYLLHEKVGDNDEGKSKTIVDEMSEYEYTPPRRAFVPDASFDAAVTGTLVSDNCGFDFVLNATTFKMREYYAKASNYGYVSIGTVLLQLYALAKQIEYVGNTQSSLSKLSLLSIGFQATLDAYLCLGHLIYGMVVEEIFPSFACVAFLEFMMFSVFEMRLLLHVWKIRNASNNNSSWIALRRELSALYGKFYGGFFGGAFLIYILQNFQTFCVLLLSSYWLPQILWNLYSNSRKPFIPLYVGIITITRTFIPLYFYGCPKNFARNEPNYVLCAAVTLYVSAQSLILFAQHYFHPRIITFKLTKWLPEVHNYHKSYVEVGDCSICLSTLKSSRSSEMQMHAPCGHIFHTHCLSRWMDVKLECPTCRSKLPPV